MDPKFLDSRTQFTKSCKKYVAEKGWNEHPIQDHSIDHEVQMQLLEGFKKFYDKRHRKYKKIEDAVGVAFVKTIRKSWCFAMVGKDGTKTTVSKNCRKLNPRKDIETACHCVLRASKKKFKRAAFTAAFKKFIKVDSTEELYTHVIHNDPSTTTTIKGGYKSLKEPLFQKWLDIYASELDESGLEAQMSSLTVDK